jgi:hypothetical protein
MGNEKRADKRKGLTSFIDLNKFANSLEISYI